jgi:hypothetical protein
MKDAVKKESEAEIVEITLQDDVTRPGEMTFHK